VPALVSSSARSTKRSESFGCLLNRETDAVTKRLFLDYVVAHAERRALADTVAVDLAVPCGSCGLELTKSQRALALERGKSKLDCMICGSTIDVAGIDLGDDSNELVIRQMDETADAERELSAARASLVGKEAIGEFDVFLAHNSADKPQIRRLGEHLRNFGIHPWIDEEQIPPGRWFQASFSAPSGRFPSPQSLSAQRGWAGGKQWNYARSSLSAWIATYRLFRYFCRNQTFQTTFGSSLSSAGCASRKTSTSLSRLNVYGGESQIRRTRVGGLSPYAYGRDRTLVTIDSRHRTRRLCPLPCPRASAMLALEPSMATIIIRVSGVRVPPPAPHETPPNGGFSFAPTAIRVAISGAAV
jgi:hypothetical protein